MVQHVPSPLDILLHTQAAAAVRASLMARYFFDFRDNDKFIADDTGTVLAGLAEAKVAAATALAEYALEVINGPEERLLRVEVRHHDGPLFRTQIVFDAIDLKDGDD